MTREKVDELICRALRERTDGHEILTSLAWGMIQGARLNERAAERVRCAKIADSFVRAAAPYRNDPPAEKRADDTAIAIAARIREGQDL